MTVALDVSDVHLSFGGVKALNGAALQVDRGAVVGVIGPNGAGKTTLFDVISGFARPDSGAVVLSGVDVTRWGVRRRASSGLGRGFQDAGLYAALTVTEALAVSEARRGGAPNLAASLLGLRSARRRELATATGVDALVKSFGLGDFANKFVSELSTGTRRVVELACLAAQEPQVLLLDEPSSGIAQREVEALGSLIVALHRRLGCAMVIIEHDIPLVSTLADELVAMDAGAVVARGRPADVLADDRVVSSYLGTNELTVARSGGHR